MSKKGMNRKIKFFLCFTLLVALIAFDQFTKYMATIKLQGKSPFVILDGIFEFHFLEGGNTGAAWGILSGKTTFFIVITIIVCLLIGYIIFRLEYMIKNSMGSTNTILILQIAFITLLAGAVGNLIDRVANGFVVDFLYFKLINFPIFNVADCYVTCSAFLLVVFFIFFVSDEEFTNIFSLKNMLAQKATDDISETTYDDV